MTKQENIDNPDSCWNKAALDEPVFILRANDPYAADAALQWAINYRKGKEALGLYKLPEMHKYASALRAIDDMRDWLERKLQS